MVRFRDAESALSFKVKMEQRARERKVYAAECIEAVLPKPKDTAITKERLFDLATEYASAKNNLKDQSFWKGRTAKFRTYLDEQWSEIRRVLQEDLGISVEFGYGIMGIRRAGKRGLLATLEWERQIHEAIKNGYNADVEAARGFVEAPTIRTALIPPAR